MSDVSPKLRPAYATDSVKEFHGVCSRMLPPFTGLGDFLYPEILSNMASYRPDWFPAYTHKQVAEMQ